jgi:hypothetical protein
MEIFHDERNCARFLKLPSESAQRFEAVILCFVLMGSHFHVVVQTHRANLRRWMDGLGDRKQIAARDRRAFRRLGLCSGSPTDSPNQVHLQSSCCTAADHRNVKCLDLTPIFPVVEKESDKCRIMAQSGEDVAWDEAWESRWA